jgi:hypothetical protein
MNAERSIENLMRLANGSTDAESLYEIAAAMRELGQADLAETIERKAWKLDMQEAEKAAK